MMKVELLRIFLGWDLDVFRPGLILHDACVIALVCVQVLWHIDVIRSLVSDFVHLDCVVAGAT